LSGGRDGMVRLWDLNTRGEVSALNVGAEVRCCFCMPDAETAVGGDVAGRGVLVSLPAFGGQAQVGGPARVVWGGPAASGGGPAARWSASGSRASRMRRWW